MAPSNRPGNAAGRIMRTVSPTGRLGTRAVGPTGRLGTRAVSPTGGRRRMKTLAVTRPGGADQPEACRF